MEGEERPAVLSVDYDFGRIPCPGIFWTQHVKGSALLPGYRRDFYKDPCQLVRIKEEVLDRARQTHGEKVNRVLARYASTLRLRLDRLEIRCLSASGWWRLHPPMKCIALEGTKPLWREDDGSESNSCVPTVQLEVTGVLHLEWIPCMSPQSADFWDSILCRKGPQLSKPKNKSKRLGEGSWKGGGGGGIACGDTKPHLSRRQRRRMARRERKRQETEMIDALEKLCL